MRERFSSLKTHFIIITCAPLIGLLALLLVHLLPTAPMKEHVYWSLDMIEKEFTDELLIEGNPATLTGNFTDCLMLEHAIYTNSEHTILEQVLRMFRGETYYDINDVEGWWPGQSLVDYLHNIPQPREAEYARYWHGYLLILKPLLLLTSFNSIRVLNSALQLLIVGLVVMALCKNNISHIAIAYLISLPFMFYVSTYASLSLSICFYIMNISLLIQLKWENKLFTSNYYALFFLIIGICTSYFDFLTYPLITLAYPLSIYFVIHNDNIYTNIKKIFFYSLEWGIGYSTMWASKWILTDLLTGSHTIKNAVDTIFLRTQSVENTSRVTGFLDVIILNLQPFANWGFLLLLLVIVAYTIVRLLQSDLKKAPTGFTASFIFILLALLPFVWYLVIQNHSFWHWQFTCRIISATVFSGIICLSTFFENTSRRQIK